MFESGVSLPRALELLGEQSPSRPLARVSHSLASSIQSGKSISKAMSAHPFIFTDVQRRLVQAGEQSGRLALVFRRIADYEEQRMALTQKIKSALVTPILVCIFCFFLAVLLPPLCLRSMLTMLSESGVSLPWPSRLLIAFANLTGNWTFYAVLSAAVILGYFGGLRLWRRPELRLRIWKIFLVIPVLCEVLTLVGTIRFAQTLCSLLETGYNLLPALTLSAQASGDPLLEDNIDCTTGLLKDGETLANALRAAEFFPRSFIETIHTGEEVGNPAQMMASYVRMSQADLDYRLEVFTNALEPLFMLAVGGVVGFISIAALLPMLKLIETL